MTLTDAPASAVPLTVMLPRRSVALIKSSPATVKITGVLGAAVSMVTGSGTPTQLLGFPAASMVRASISTPVASAGISPLVKVIDQRPPPLDVVDFAVPPAILTSTVVTFGAVPEMETEAFFSAALIMSLPAIGVVITGTAGGPVSTVIARVAVGLTLPSVSVWKTERFGEPSAGTSPAAKSIDQR